ncbi:hypothetical protein NIES2109_62200 (plasmid) [Nostoc sp. HK-01]|nr:hypothetical protein NIES2109_62200 [Nostoc sp. HK-01]
MKKILAYFVQSICLGILAVTYLSNIKVLAQTINVDHTSITETPKSTSNRLQKLLIDQNKPEAALEISERSRNRSLLDMLGERSFTSAATPLSTEQIKQVAKQQNATLVQYSIINEEFIIAGKKQTKESQLYIWVIQPTGDIAFRSVDLKPLWQKENTSLTDLITRTRRTMGVSSSYLKGIFIDKQPNQKTNANQQLQKLHQILIAPILDVLPTQANAHIIFTPQGELFSVPFAALKDTSNLAPDKKRQY